MTALTHRRYDKLAHRIVTLPIGLDFCHGCGDYTLAPNRLCSIECVLAYVADQHDEKPCDDSENCPVCREHGAYGGAA
jgi:ribosomal protein L32